MNQTISNALNNIIKIEDSRDDYFDEISCDNKNNDTYGTKKSSNEVHCPPLWGKHTTKDINATIATILPINWATLSDTISFMVNCRSNANSAKIQSEK